MNLIKTTEHIINLDHVARISISSGPAPRVIFYFVAPRLIGGVKNSVENVVVIEGAEAAELLKDLEGLHFISSGLSGEAAGAAKEEKRQEKQAFLRSLASDKRKLIMSSKHR